MISIDFLLEKGGNGSGDLVVFGVGGETKILVPNKCENSKGLVEAMSLMRFVLWYVSSLLLYLFWLLYI